MRRQGKERALRPTKNNMAAYHAYQAISESQAKSVRITVRGLRKQKNVYILHNLSLLLLFLSRPDGSKVWDPDDPC